MRAAILLPLLLLVAAAWLVSDEALRWAVTVGAVIVGGYLLWVLDGDES